MGRPSDRRGEQHSLYGKWAPPVQTENLEQLYFEIALVVARATTRHEGASAIYLRVERQSGRRQYALPAWKGKDDLH
jgi:hypothetical protein